MENVFIAVLFLSASGYVLYLGWEMLKDISTSPLPSILIIGFMCGFIPSLCCNAFFGIVLKD